MNNRECGLRHFIIPQVIGVIWWITVTLAVLGIISSFLIPWQLGRSMGSEDIQEALKNLLWISLALFGVRVFLESISVVFSIHDRLEEILNALNTNTAQIQRLNAETSTTGIPRRTKPQLFS